MIIVYDLCSMRRITPGYDILCSYKNAIKFMDKRDTSSITIDPSGYGDFVIMKPETGEKFYLEPDYVISDSGDESEYNCRTIFLPIYYSQLKMYHMLESTPV